MPKRPAMAKTRLRSLASILYNAASRHLEGTGPRGRNDHLKTMRRTSIKNCGPFRALTFAVRMAAVCVAVCLAGCGVPSEAPAAFVATIPPVAAILNELIRGGRASVTVLVPPGASPHAYSLRPSGARQAAAAAAVFFVDDSIDGWAAPAGAEARISLFSLVPNEFRRRWDAGAHPDSEEEFNSHFWPDPLAVCAMLPRLVDELVALDPADEEVYRRNGERFAEALTRLDTEIRDDLAGARSSSVVVFHPSWNYYLDRYGIAVAATIEPSPGHEPTPRRIRQIAEIIREEDIAAVLTEPQLPRRSAEVVAEDSGAEIVEIDPIGGVAGRESYAELLDYNTRKLIEALR